MANKIVKVTHDTTSIVTDRLAKIATVYTRGEVTVRYTGAVVATDVRGTIFLPAALRDFSPEQAPTAWCYVSHEMGHQDVENRLLEAKGSSETGASEAIFALVPPELASVVTKAGSAPGALTQTTMANFFGPESEAHIRSIGRKLASALAVESGKFIPSKEFDALAARAGAQFRQLVNIFEDPRMEAIVSRRWAGAKVYLEEGNRVSIAKWRDRALELIASGADGSFDIFGIGLLFSLFGEDITFLGPRVAAQVAKVQDIVDVYRVCADWETPLGFFDAVNAAAATLARVYRPEAAAEPPVPSCPKCGSTNLTATRGKAPGTVRVTCRDCGFHEAMEAQAGPGAPSESSGDDAGDASDASGAAGTGGGSDGGSGGGDGPVLEPGMTIRDKATGELREIVAVDGGRVTTKPFTGGVVRKGKLYVPTWSSLPVKA